MDQKPAARAAVAAPTAVSFGPTVCGGPVSGRAPALSESGASIAIEKQFAGVTVRAVRQDAMTVRDAAEGAGDAAGSLWLVQRGSGTVRSATEIDFRAGDAIVVPPAMSVAVTAVSPLEMLHLLFRGKARWWPSSVWVSGPTASSVIAFALASSVLTATPSPTHLEGGHLRSALEIIALSTVMATAGTSRTDPLVNRADAVIVENAHDPDFTVETLARRLSVSRRHLTRVLSEAGRSPAHRIRDVRVARARAAWAAHGDELFRDDLLARWFGFRSARALRENLSRVDTLDR